MRISPFLILSAVFNGGVFFLAITLMDSCESPGSTYRKNHSHADITDEHIAMGEKLAATYCQSCHLLPDPGQLDANSWAGTVLPQMGPRLGIFDYQYKRYPNNSADPNVGNGFYPSAPLLSAQDWGYILDYYTALSPDTLPAQQRKDPIVDDPAFFKVEFPVPAANAASGTTPAGAIPPVITPPATCFIRYDPSLHQIFTSDILRHSLNRWDKDLHELPAVGIDGAIVDMIMDTLGYTTCNIGAFSPNNAKAGHIDLFAKSAGKPIPGKSISGEAFPGKPAPLYDGLMRPVNLASADLNGDGKTDMVVCEFGFIKGELSWLENKDSGRFEKHVLRNIPGSIRVIVQDYNHDGLPDIWVLFAQGDEGILLYTNKGKGQFTEKEILRFPPSYGSTYFELDDFNKDGFPDILYTCGDNGDFSTVLKPYHGIYIFVNDGKEHFTQQYFFPMNGCYRAMAADFNGDGRPDIAAIAYFADYLHQPEEGFVFLLNKGNNDTLRFGPHGVPGSRVGRWMTMDVQDMDGDGRPDILLGNCSVGPSFLKPPVDFKKGPPFLLLRNLGK